MGRAQPTKALAAPTVTSSASGLVPHHRVARGSQTLCVEIKQICANRTSATSMAPSRFRSSRKLYPAWPDHSPAGWDSARSSWNQVGLREELGTSGPVNRRPRFTWTRWISTSAPRGVCAVKRRAHGRRGPVISNSLIRHSGTSPCCISSSSQHNNRRQRRQRRQTPKCLRFPASSPSLVTMRTAQHDHECGWHCSSMSAARCHHTRFKLRLHTCCKLRLTKNR